MANPYLSDLLGVLEDRYAVEGKNMGIASWLEANTTHRSRPFGFRGYAFQRAIADDMHPDLDVMKISQVGLSEIMQRKALAICVRNPGRVGIFSLPNEAMYRRFSQSRLQPLLESDRVFRGREGETRSMSLVQIGSSFLHVVNATEASATSTSADFVFTDEVDLSDQKVLALFASRVQNSDMAVRQRFSTPTWTGFGIDATYSASDQREFGIKCRACNHWQVPLFDRRWVDIPGLAAEGPLADLDDASILSLNLEPAHPYVVCERCRAPLDLDDESTREWIAAFPSRTQGRGYRVRPFSAGRITVPYILAQLVQYRRRDFVRGWWNTVLGEPYIDSRSRLDEATIRANFVSPGVPDLAPGTPVHLGIDMGQVCHVILGRETSEGAAAIEFSAVRVSEIVSFVREVKERYLLVGGCCDRHPYTPTADELFDETQGIVVPVEYRGDKDLNPVKQADGTVRHWQGNRTRLLDEVARLIRLKRLPMLGYGNQSGVLVEHFRDMIRQENPEEPATWIKLNGNDHYFHAAAFMLASIRLKGLWSQISGMDNRSMVFLSGFGLSLKQPLIGGQGPQRVISRY